MPRLNISRSDYGFAYSTDYYSNPPSGYRTVFAYQPRSSALTRIIHTQPWWKYRM